MFLLKDDDGKEFVVTVRSESTFRDHDDEALSFSSKLFGNNKDCINKRLMPSARSSFKNKSVIEKRGSMSHTSLRSHGEVTRQPMR